MTTSENLVDYLGAMAIFAKVVDHKGFSAAARQIRLTKSAISKQVSGLEQTLGVRLLHRTTRALSLTEAGQALYERASQSVALAEEARAAVAQMTLAPRGTLRVTASVAFGKLCIAPLVPAFLARYPEVRVHLGLLDRFVDLADEGYDLAIRLARVLPEGVVAKRLKPINYVVCAAPAYLRNRPRLRSPADLAAHECLYYGSGEFGDTWSFERDRSHGRPREGQPGRGRENVRVTARFVVNSSEVIREAVLAGAGIGLLPMFVVQRDLADARLTRLLAGWRPQGPFGSAAYAVWLPDRYLPPKVRAFVEFLEAGWRDATM
jgi:DNA-binding transcriptional LysR family regulator